MDSPVIALEKVLRKQKDIYERLSSIEEGKTNVIIKRDGQSLERLALEQEKLISEISVLETKRSELVKEYASANEFNELGEIPLSSIVRNMDEDSALRLTGIAFEIRKSALKTRSLSETNNRLIADNLEFFDILLTGIKSSARVAAGYTRDGESATVMKSALLFNATV